MKHPQHERRRGKERPEREEALEATRYVASAEDPERLVVTGLPEVAFIGRSNVGKSSLLGMVLGRPKLVRTSRTPGRTQALNLFVLDNQLALVDLPGYGYAKLSKGQRAALEQLVRGYLGRRQSLRGVVLLVDARRDEVSPLDQAMARHIQELGRPLLVVVTKVDLIPRSKLQPVVRGIERELGLPEDSALPCSAHSGAGREQLRRSLFELRG